MPITVRAGGESLVACHHGVEFVDMGYFGSHHVPVPEKSGSILSTPADWLIAHGWSTNGRGHWFCPEHTRLRNLSLFTATTEQVT